MSIKIRPVYKTYTPERQKQDTQSSSPYTNQKGKSYLQTPATNVFTEEHSYPDEYYKILSTQQKDEVEYWRNKALENQQLIDEMRKLSQSLQIYEKDEIFKAFIRDKLQRFESENDESNLKLQISYLKQKVKDQDGVILQYLNQLEKYRKEINTYQQQITNVEKTRQRESVEYQTEVRKLIDYYESNKQSNQPDQDSLQSKLREKESEIQKLFSEKLRQQEFYEQEQNKYYSELRRIKEQLEQQNKVINQKDIEYLQQRIREKDSEKTKADQEIQKLKQIIDQQKKEHSDEIKMIREFQENRQGQISMKEYENMQQNLREKEQEIQKLIYEKKRLQDYYEQQLQQFKVSFEQQRNLILENKVNELEQQRENLTRQIQNLNDKHEKQKDQISMQLRSEIEDLRNQYEQKLEQMRYQSSQQVNYGEIEKIRQQDAYEFEREKQRIIDSYEQKLMSLNGKKGTNNNLDISHIQDQLFELEKINQENAQQLFLLRDEKNRLQNDNTMLQGQIKNQGSDNEKREMLILLQKAQQLCRDLDNEKQGLERVVNDLKDEIQKLRQSSQTQPSRQVSQSQFIPISQQIQPEPYIIKEVTKDTSLLNQYIKELEVCKQICSKLEKQKDIELNLKDQNYRELIQSYENSIKQLRESYELQVQSMKQITDAKIKETEELRQLNQTLSIGLNQQIIKFQQLMIELESLKQKSTQPQNNIQQYVNQIRDLQIQLQNLQHLLQLKCMECDQFKKQLFK